MSLNRLHNLLARNRRRGEFRAEAGAEGGNTIYLYDSIVASEADAEWWGGVAADTFVRTLLAMSGPVTIRINSPGGDVFASRAMAQAIREYPDQVTAQVDGYAASAASFITSVADRTVMAPGAMLMIHKAWTVAWGNADDMTATASLLSKIDNTISATYTAAAEKRGKEASDFLALMAAETWLTEQEAIDIGLADEVLGDTDKQATAQARARWDLSAYSKAPKPQSKEPVQAPPAQIDPAKPAAQADADAVKERERRMRMLQASLLETA